MATTALLRTSIFHVLAGALLCLSPAQGWAWGDEGHRIVALVAESRLTDRARDATRALLDGDNLITVATWADAVKGERSETASWHYTDIPKAADSYDPTRDCPQGNCAVEQVERFRTVLDNQLRPRSERIEALKFLVHLVADLHQPLHSVDDRDRGGNEVLVTFMGQRTRPDRDRPWNLHAVWDYGLIEQVGMTETDYARHLTRWLRGQPVAEWERGTVLDWTLEAHRVAVAQAYAVPADRQLGADYLRAMRPALDTMLAKAGVRLAKMLNDLFRK
ncbi:MAG: S1/P1 nuclease [Nitrospirota bacterium]